MRTIPLLVVVSLAACGGPGSVDGKVKGQNYAVSSSASAAVTLTVATTQLHGAAIAMTSTGGLCADLGANTVHPGQQYVTIFLSDVNNLTFSTPTVPGTYSIYQSNTSPPPKAATMSLGTYDATCQKIDSQSAAASSGTVMLDTVSGNKFAGTFDVVLDSGDHVTGEFDPQECPGIQTAINSGDQAVCK